MADDGSFRQFHLIRFNDEQDFLFVRIGIDKCQEIHLAALEIAPGGMWVGEYAEHNGNVCALVFVHAHTSNGPDREEVVSLLNQAVTKVSQTLQAQLPN